ncbi:hypothetical protein QFC21_001375 [Naganishia friedmannii]|uniref:Uncharacterized protein n=1 Tax=Naganishia friedmannii TaxID=89922 RepID=A0ACC2W596_9TREE|nr:hypothetical protein QFC21_001375 [Naganishia friedmannii]
MLPSLPLPLPQQRDFPPPEPSPALSTDESSTTGSSAPPDTPFMGTEPTDLDRNPLEDQSILSVVGVKKLSRNTEVAEEEGSSGAEGDKVAHAATSTHQRTTINRAAAPIANTQATTDTSISIEGLQDENPPDSSTSDSQRRDSYLSYPTETTPATVSNPPTTNMSTFTFPSNTAPAATDFPSSSENRITPRPHPLFSIHEAASSSALPEPSAPFTFGSFRLNEPTTNVLGTPTAELGPFDYPVDGGLAVGGVMSPAIRRLVEDEQGNSLLPPGFTPSLRRTSSTSTVPISPAGGRRPSVVHSNTVPQADAGRRLSLAGDGEGLGPHSASAIVAAVDEEERMLRGGEAGSDMSKEHVGPDAGTERIRRMSMASAAGSFGSSAPSPTSISGRRPSILAFAHQPLPDAPIPPSLAHLASTLRRGSTPVNHFSTMNVPPRDRQSSVSSMSSLRSSISSASGMTAAVARNSLTGPVFINQGTRDEHMTVSSAYLYQRRSSLASTSRGLLSSKAPLPPSGRPGVLPNQQRTGSVSSSSSSNPSSSGSRESVMTIRDLREDWEGRPSFSRQGDSDEGASPMERNRRMSMPSLPSPSSSALGNDNEGPHWLPQTRPKNSSMAQPALSTEINKFSFPPQVSATYVKPRPFQLGMPPSPRTHSTEAFHTQHSDSSRTTGSSSSSSTHSGTSQDGRSPIMPHVPSSSEELSDVSAEPSDTPSKRTYRISQRGIEERERRRSSRMSALMTTTGNSLETIPSDNVVDFSTASRSAARSSFSSSKTSTSGINHSRPSKHVLQSENGMPAGQHASHERSALSTSSSEEGPEEGLSSENEEKSNHQQTDGDEGGAGVATAFRAFAFPPSSRTGSSYGGNGI